MIFTGDIAIPFEGAIELRDIPDYLKQKVWVCNLEGSLVEDRKIESENLISNNKVFNSLNAIEKLQRTLNIQVFNIANNHLLDVANVEETTKNIDSLGVQSIGGGNDSNFAKHFVDIQDEDGEFYTILSFGWDCIGCVYAKNNQEGVNPYKKENVVRLANEALSKGNKIICFFHWNYELELYPQPFDRRFAMDLIDMGISAVIGCHAHRTQQIEFYKGKPIVYGLGNFLFRNGSFFNGKLSFPSFTYPEWVFELKGNEYILHQFKYDPNQHIVVYQDSISISEQKVFKGKAEYSGLDDTSYLAFFKKKRVQKRLLPVFKANEKSWMYSLKSSWILVRGKLINIMTSLNLKKSDRSKR